MAEDILSQDEIDALLTGVDDGDIETSSIRSDLDYSSYDLSSQDRIVNSRLPTLEVVNEKICRHLRVALFSLLKRSVEVEREPVRILKYGEYLDALATPSCLSVVRVQPLRGSALLTLEQGLVVKLVDIFFGGEGHEPKLEARDFTPTELRIANRFLDFAIQGVAESWKQIENLSIEMTSQETNPAMISIATLNDPIILNAFKITVDGFSSEFHFAIPYAVIDSVKEALMTTGKANSEQPEASWAAAIRRDILRADIQLGCTIAEREISLRDVVDLKEGDVIPIDMAKEHVLEANGVPVFNVRMGRSRGQLALEVCGRVDLEQLD